MRAFAATGGLSGRRLLVAMLIIFAAAVIPAVVVPTLMCRNDPPLADCASHDPPAACSQRCDSTGATDGCPTGFHCGPQGTCTNEYGTLPDFTLTDERGETFTQEALRGHPTVLDFVFTRCDQICPTMTMRMRGVQDKTFDAGKRLKFVSISVDPGYDTPERLAAYARENHADPERWRFLTGSNAQIRALVEGPLMNSMRREREINSIPQIGHTGHFYLIDGDLRIRGIYGSSDVTRLDELMRDARYLIRTRKRD